MRVVFVGPFPWPSPQGSQTYLAGQARALARRGHDVRVVTHAGVGGEIPGVELVRARPIPGGAFRDGGLHPSRPLHDLAMARALRRTVRERPADMLHVHNVEGPWIARAARTGLPIVYDPHTAMEEELAAHLPRRFARLGRPVGGWLDRAALAASDAGCAISERALALLEGAGLPSALVGPGVDPDEIVPSPGARARFGPGPWVVYAGNLDAYQDLPTWFDAMRGLPARPLVVTASDAPLPAEVVAVRSRDWRVAVDALSIAEIAVIPRTRCAGFPIKLLNQLAVGAPTVGIRGAVPALPGVVACEPGALRDTLRDLLADPARRRALSEAGRREVRARWTWDARAAQLEALYARVRGR